MKKMMMVAGLCMAVSGCIGFSWTSKVDDGAIYELNREMYIAEEDGLILCVLHNQGNTSRRDKTSRSRKDNPPRILLLVVFWSLFSRCRVWGSSRRRFQRESCRLWRASPALSQARILVSVSA